jgi:hypothetical protein
MNENLLVLSQFIDVLDGKQRNVRRSFEEMTMLSFLYYIPISQDS